jgi:hypothetical protein
MIGGRGEPVNDRRLVILIVQGQGRMVSCPPVLS